MEMEGPMHVDIFQQNRLLINGVGLVLRLWPSKDAFRLISNEDDASYEVQILDVSFNLCLQKPNAGVLIAHTNLIAYQIRYLIYSYESDFIEGLLQTNEKKLARSFNFPFRITFSLNSSRFGDFR